MRATREAWRLAAVLLLGIQIVPIMDARFAQIGISRDGTNWRILLAQPQLSADLGDWREGGKQILELTNAARAQPRSCGAEHFSAAPPVSWDERLARTALAHSENMAKGNYFSHTGKDGERVNARANRAGYAWQRIGENIATAARARPLGRWPPASQAPRTAPTS